MFKCIQAHQHKRSNYAWASPPYHLVVDLRDSRTLHKREVVTLTNSDIRIVNFNQRAIHSTSQRKVCALNNSRAWSRIGGDFNDMRDVVQSVGEICTTLSVTLDRCEVESEGKDDGPAPRILVLMSCPREPRVAPLPVVRPKDMATSSTDWEKFSVWISSLTLVPGAAVFGA